LTSQVAQSTTASCLTGHANGPRDLNALAASTVNDATNEDKTEPADDGRTRLPSRWGGAVG